LMTMTVSEGEFQMLHHPWPCQQPVSILFRWQLFTPQGQGARQNHTYHVAFHHQQPIRSPLPERAHCPPLCCNEEAMTASGAPIRILVVEDSRTQALRVAQILEDAGYLVLLVINGHDALAQARTVPPDLILSDVLMPGMDGFTLCREIRRDDRLAAVPVVLYTATFLDPKDAEFARAVGVTRYLLKPSNIADVLTQIHEIIGEGQHSVDSPLIEPLGDAVFTEEHRERLLATLDGVAPGYGQF
jgi:CheY-like chemotaxis protein